MFLPTPGLVPKEDWVEMKWRYFSTGCWEPTPRLKEEEEEENKTTKQQNNRSGLIKSAKTLLRAPVT